MRTQPRLNAAAIVIGFTLFAIPSVFASTIAINPADFGVGSTLTTFAGLASGTEVNGLTVDGISFAYSLGNGAVVIDGGPGVTINITPPNVVSVGNDTGILTLTFPSLIDAFGYGYAILSTSPVATATTISLFNGAASVGSLSYSGTPDPVFAGGFAGIQSTLLFNRAELRFNSTVAPAFALDNVRTAATLQPVPEPTSVLLVGAGLGAMARLRLRRKGRTFLGM